MLLAQELNDGTTTYLIERALDEAKRAAVSADKCKAWMRPSKHHTQALESEDRPKGYGPLIFHKMSGGLLRRLKKPMFGPGGGFSIPFGRLARARIKHGSNGKACPALTVHGGYWRGKTEHSNMQFVPYFRALLRVLRNSTIICTTVGA